MGIDDRAENKAEDVKGRAKEATGAVLGDNELKAEGQADQKKAGLKDKLEDVKDKIKNVID